MAAIPSKTWSKRGRRWRRLLERLVPDRRRDALAGAATVDEDLLLPLDRGLERWDEPDLLRGRGGGDARVAMLGRLQDQWPDGGGHTPGSVWICEMRPTRVRASNREDSSGRQVHLRGSEVFTALGASVVRALPTERKWSKPAANSHAAPSTKTPE